MIVGGLDVQFLDINLTVAPDKNTAEANLTLRAKTAGDRDQIVQEMKLLLNKLEGNWRIQRIETVKTLSRGGDTWPVSNQGVGAVVRIEITKKCACLSLAKRIEGTGAKAGTAELWGVPSCPKARSTG
jgi:hypothetical protein